MQYCQNCLIPDTRPNISFDESGLCNACRGTKTKDMTDWDAREKSFRRLVEETRTRSKGYDCVIPVSGGKDSTWQVAKCLEYGLKPLCVTWKTPARTEIGTRNLQNLINLGVDHIDYQISPKVERKFLKEALKRYGATGIPMHMAIFNIPIKIAVRFDIPLVVWGENSALEYGGKEDEWLGSRLDSNWLKKYGVTHGTTAKDWICDSLSEKELTPYFGPTQEEIDSRDVRAIFLGYYFKWDPVMTAEAARELGFEFRQEGPKTGLYEFADIDDEFISIHHYLKWYKFGMTRLFDNLSIEIRNGRMTREKALEILKNTGEQTPWEDIEKFCRFTQMSKEEFFAIAEKFRNHDIWYRDGETWKLKDFIIPEWSWV